MIEPREHELSERSSLPKERLLDGATGECCHWLAPSSLANGVRDEREAIYSHQHSLLLSKPTKRWTLCRIDLRQLEQNKWGLTNERTILKTESSCSSNILSSTNVLPLRGGFMKFSTERRRSDHGESAASFSKSRHFFSMRCLVSMMLSTTRPNTGGVASPLYT